MSYVLRFSTLVFVFSFAMMWLAVWIGVWLRKRRRSLEENEREDFGIVMTAILTLLGLIIAFSFSMAITRYDQRKTLEEAEANAIGTEYARADFLPAPDVAKVRALLREYLDQRILFYTTRDDRELAQIEANTAQLEADLWYAVWAPANAQGTMPLTITAMGMNDVVNSRGYTQAAWLNRIPKAAWCLMVIIAVCCNLLIGYGSSRGRARTRLLLVLPLVIAISFTLIADIDAPRGGVVRVDAENLTGLSKSLHAHKPNGQ
jgi:protein-S-isoprenylcysteine O-methyltransferase Ste14